MSDAHDAQAVKAAVRKYLIIFGALIVGTIVTVLVSFVHFGEEGSNTINILVALAIASVKAFLVAGYFMHLISERKMIYGILLATVFFFAGLMYLTVWSMEPVNLVHIKADVP
ncbi:MAG: cytochrome C oxidase subunit IV family protein [Verrucomicrobia bacterium]|nr:cytochrome C oxidase subunit IV family protein [Verrucomicrobiota bacterium]